MGSVGGILSAGRRRELHLGNQRHPARREHADRPEGEWSNVTENMPTRSRGQTSHMPEPLHRLREGMKL